MSLKFVKQQFPNIEHDPDDDEVTKAEHYANLLHRVMALGRCLNGDYPPFLVDVQLGLVYDRLEKMEDVFDIQPEIIEPEPEEYDDEPEHLTT